MNKLILSAAMAFIGLSVSAQGISVTMDGKPVENGSTITSYNVSKEDYEQELGGEIYQWTEYMLDPKLYASASNGTYTIKLTNNTTSTSIVSMIQFCWPDGCEIIQAGSSLSRTGNLNSTPSNLRIESYIWDYLIESPFTMSCDVEISQSGSSSNKFSFTLNLVYDPEYQAGVEGIIDEAAYPVEYFDLTGKRILNPEKGKVVIEKRGPKAHKRIF